MNQPLLPLSFPQGESLSVHPLAVNRLICQGGLTRRRSGRESIRFVTEVFLVVFFT